MSVAADETVRGVEGKGCGDRLKLCNICVTVELDYSEHLKATPLNGRNENYLSSASIVYVVFVLIINNDIRLCLPAPQSHLVTLLDHPSKVYLGFMCSAQLYSIAEAPQHPTPPPAFGLIYKGAIGQPRWTTSLCDLLILSLNNQLHYDEILIKLRLKQRKRSA